MDPSIIDAVDMAVRARRSVRDFKPDPVDLAEVVRVLEVGSMAPSAWNLQPWRFVVVTDHETRQQLQAAAYNQRQVGQAPVVVVLYCDMVESLRRIDDHLPPAMPAEAKATYKGNIERSFAAMTPDQRDQWGNAQGNILLGYLLLLFEVHGFGTSPMLGFDPAAVRSLLGLPDHAAIPALIAVGHAAGPNAGPPHRLQFGEVHRFVGEGS